MSDLVASLWITLIGMGLVFIGILLLWGLMEVIVRVTARFAGKEEEEGEEEGESEPEAAPLPAVDGSLKKRAAAAAVAVALALRKPVARVPLARPADGGSAWQSVARASQLNHPTQLARKSRGNVR